MSVRIGDGGAGVIELADRRQTLQIQTLIVAGFHDVARLERLAYRVEIVLVRLNALAKTSGDERRVHLDARAGTGDAFHFDDGVVVRAALFGALDVRRVDRAVRGRVARRRAALGLVFHDFADGDGLAAVLV